jgi:hypothetical protein
MITDGVVPVLLPGDLRRATQSQLRMSRSDFADILRIAVRGVEVSKSGY